MRPQHLEKILVILLCALSLGAHAYQPTAQPAVEAAFSPGDGAQALILRVIDSSQQSIRLAAYAFTSPPVITALIAAKRRGVDVRVAVDGSNSKSKSGIAALNLVVNAGIPARTVAAYKIHHDKFIVSDGKTVQTGSFNYSASAAKANSENVIVVRDNPELAVAYTQHWQSRWNKGVDWHSTY